MDPPPKSRGIPVILNPGARSSRAAGRTGEIRALSPRIELHETTQAGDAKRIAARLAAAGEPVIVAAGGDGTVNEVINGIVEAGATGRTALGVLPTGTMNVYAAELGIPAARLDECWRIIERGHERQLDLWRMNDVHFAQLAGAGFDAAVIRDTSWERKKMLGPLSYVWSGIQGFRRDAPPITVTAPDRPALNGSTVLFGNGRHYGGPFRLFPDASLTDGMIDVIVLRSHGTRQLVTLGVSLIAGRPLPGQDIVRFQAPSVALECPAPVPFQTDGDYAGAARRIEVSPAGSPLRVLA